MNDEIRFRIEGTPKAWRRPRFNRTTGAIFTASQDQTWRDSIWGQAMPFAPKVNCLDWPVRLDLVFYFPIPKSLSAKKRSALQGQPHCGRPDLDNLLKAVVDALTGPFWFDDKQIYEMHIGKLYSTISGRPGVAVDIRYRKTLAAAQKGEVKC